MCGFAGLLFDSAVDSLPLESMIKTLQHRGPDSLGVWRNESKGVGLAHARLAILDLSTAGQQPMQSQSGRYVIVFNGEIYNHYELRLLLEKEKYIHNWRGHSDTETLLACFEYWGITSTIEKAVGMFAFAVWDNIENVLILARDRLGEKPLYYGWQGGVFLFGSELKALKAHNKFNDNIDRKALDAYTRFGYVPAPKSIYKGIYKLTPGTLLLVKSGGKSFELVQYWSFLEIARKGIVNPFQGSDDDAVKVLEDRLARSVKMQQISDVPLGAFLSGGVDSSTVVALMQANSSRPVQTFTIGFDEKQYNEADNAKAVAKYLGTEHIDLLVTPGEARNVIPILPALYDEPFADSSQIPTFLVSKLARKSVKVCLSGDGADELFGGYNRYLWGSKINSIPFPIRYVLSSTVNMISPQQWDSLNEAMKPFLPKSLRFGMVGNKIHKTAAILKEKSVEEIYFSLVSSWTKPESLVKLCESGYNRIKLWNQLEDFNYVELKMMGLDVLTYLPNDILQKVDRAAMGVSLEVRVPFLDHRIIDLAWSMPLNFKVRNGVSKWVLRELLFKYVPRELIERPKMGFGVPIDLWLRGPLREWAEALLNEQRLFREGFFHPIPIRQKWEQHLSGKYNWQQFLWNILMFQAWYQDQSS